MSTPARTTGPSPVAVVGIVTVSGPSARGLYRLKWPKPDGTEGDTTGSRDLEHALAKAAQIDLQYGAAAGPKAVVRLGEMFAAYLAAGRSPYKHKKPWKPANKLQIEDNLGRCLRGFENLCALEVTREICDRMRAQAGTDAMVRINTSVLRAFLVWGGQHEYLTPLQAELLPRACSMPAPALARTLSRLERPEVVPTVRLNGQAEGYISDEDAPDRTRISALSAGLAQRLPRWGALAPELAASSGPRWGEQFQLTAFDAHLDGCAEYAYAHLHVDWQVDAAGTSTPGRGRRVRPKGDKARVIPVPQLSITGYRLRDAVRARVEAALAELAAGQNPEALLFPAVEGGMLWYSSFNSDHLLPAMEAAGWPVEHWREEYPRWDAGAEKYRTVSVERRKAALTWHSLRHRFARTCVDVLRMPEGELMAVGGWENIGTVQTRYYRSGRENMERGLSYFD
jgi:hypothetical protein